MKGKESAKNFPPKEERRRFARQKVTSLVYLNVKPDNGGILLDLSEGGMCISVANPLAVSSQVQFSLGVGGSESVEGTGVVSWLSKSGRSAGVRFVRFPKGSRERVHEWLQGSNAPEEQIEAPPATGRTQPPVAHKSENGPRTTAEETGGAQAVPEAPATAESPQRTPTKESRAPSSYTIFAQQPRPPAMPEEPEPEPETLHLNLKMPSFFMPQQQETKNDSPPEAEDATETYFGGGIGISGKDGEQHVAAFRLAVASGSELHKQEDKEGLQIKKFLVVAAVCGSLLALGVVLFLIYAGTIPITRFFSAIAAPQQISQPVKPDVPRRARFSPRRPEISTRNVRGGRPARDVNTFYAPSAGGGSFPVEVTDHSHERWLATVTSRNLASGDTPDATANGIPAISGGTGSASPAAGTTGMRADGALVEEGTPAHSSAATASGPVPNEIVVEAVIGIDGDVKSVRLVSSPASQLARAVVEAVRQWHYRPFYQDGRPVQFTTKITFNFSRVEQEP